MIKYGNDKHPFLNKEKVYHEIFAILVEMAAIVTNDTIAFSPVFYNYVYQLYITMNGYDQNFIINDHVALENYIKTHYGYFYMDIGDMLNEYRKI